MFVYARIYTYMSQKPREGYALFKFIVVFQIVYILLNMPMFIGSQSFISLPSFMFVSAVVSEIRELNQNIQFVIEQGF